MIDILCLLIAIIAITYLWKKIRSSEPNKVKFYLNFFIFYFYGSLLASLIWPLFLFRPKNVDNAK